MYGKRNMITQKRGQQMKMKIDFDLFQNSF